jgi:hypothetical protein
VDLDLDIGGRDRDRAEQRSPSFETIDQLLGSRLRHALDLDPHLDPVEQHVVGVGLIVGVELGVDLYVDISDRHTVVTREHLEQLHGTGRHAAQKQLAGHELLTGKSVPGRPVHREMVVSGTQVHPAEDIRRACFSRVPSDVHHR